MASVLEGLAYIQQQGELGRQRGEQSQLRGLLGQYAATGQADLPAIARNGGDPFKVREDMQSQQDRQREQLGRFAALLTSAPEAMRPGLYKQMHPQLAQIIPDAPPEYNPEIDGLAQQIAAQFGKGGQGPKFQNLGQGYVMDGSGNVKQVYRPEEESSWGYIPDPNNPENEVYARRQGNAFYALDGRPLYGVGGQVQQAAPAPAGDVLPRLQAMGAHFPGVQMTSGLRTPERNAEVGGVPNSQHLRGTAADFVVPPALKPQFTQAAQAQGFQVLDEGDHLHTQLPKGAGRGPGPLPGSRPRYKPGAEGGSYRTMTAKEIAGLGLPAGTVAQMSPSGQVQIINKPRDLPGGQSQVIDNPDGTQTIIPAGKTTEDQNKSAGYAIRMEKALADIDRYVAADPDANRPGVGTALLDMLPDSIGNYGKDEGRLNVEAAQLDALDAALTLNTGAAYTKEQLRGLSKAYFPQPGDTEGVVQEKKARLQSLIQTAKVRARGALPQSGKLPGNDTTQADADARIGPIPSSTPAVIRYDAKGNRIK